MTMLKIALLIDEITGEPLYYKVLDGSIADATLLQNLFAELSKFDAEQIYLVLDRGFCSENNFQMMFRNNIGFVAGLKSNLKFAQQTLQEFVPQLMLALSQQHSPEIDCYCATKKIEWYSSSRASGKEYSPFYIHVCYDLQREISEKTHMPSLVGSFHSRLKKGNVPNSPVFKEFFKLKPSAKNKTRQLKNISSTLTLGINSQNPSDSLCSVSM